MEIDELIELLERAIFDGQDIDSNLLWSGLLHAGASDPRTSRYLLSSLVDRLLSVTGKDIRPTHIDCVESAIAAFSDRSSPLPSRLSVAIPLLQWLPAMALPAFRTILVSSVAYVEDFIDATGARPKSFLSLFSPTLLSDLDDSFLENALDFFLSADPLHSFRGALYLLSPFADAIACSSEAAAPRLVALLEAGLANSDPTVQSAAAFALAEVAEQLSHVPGEIAYRSELFSALVSILTGSDAGAAKCAGRAFRRLLSAEFLNADDFLLPYVETFTRHQGVHRLYFARILSTFVSPVDEEGGGEEEDDAPELGVLQPVYDWVKGALSSDDGYVRGLGLNVLADLAIKSKRGVGDLIEVGLAAAQALVDASSYETFEFIAYFLPIVAENFPANAAAVVGLISPIVGSLDNPAVGSLKLRLFAAGSVVNLFELGVSSDQLSRLVSFVISSAPTLDDFHLFVLGRVIVSLEKFMQQDAANALFDVFAARITRGTDEGYVDCWVRYLTKLLKYNEIDTERATAVASAITGATLPIFFGRKPEKCLLYGDPIYMKFVSEHIKKSPQDARRIVDTIIEWSDAIMFEPVRFLRVFNAALQVGVLDDQLAARLGMFGRRILSKHEEVDATEVASVTAVLAQLFRYFPHSLDPIDGILEVYVAIVEAAAAIGGDDQDDDDDSCEGELLEVMPAVVQFVVDVYVSSAEVAINKRLLQGVVTLLPFPPGGAGQSPIFEGIIELLGNLSKFRCICAPFAQVLVEVLMMKNEDLEQYHFSSDLIQSMKVVLKRIVQADKKLEKKFRQRFKNSKARLNLFLALVK